MSESYKHINSAVLIDLKAELFKKRNLLKEEKLHRELKDTVKVPKKKKLPDVEKKSKESLSKVEAISHPSFEEEEALQKSRQALLRKANLYEKLNASNTIADDEENEKYLVNFSKKVIDRIIEKKYNRNDENSDEDVTLEYIPTAGPDEEWVDYTDYLGRSRRCLRKDLAHLIKMDKEFGGSKSEESEYTDAISQSPQLQAQNSEQYKDQRIQQNENEEKESVSVGPVHYQNVLHREIRNHGVGYYGFSTDESERASQMKTLNDLREQTVKQREMREKLKQKRKTMLEARLEKVRQRKKLKPQEPLEADKDDLSDEDEVEQMEQQKSLKDEVKEVTEIVEEPKSLKPVKIRPWDIGKNIEEAVNVGKRKKYTQDSWIKERREERNSEFAPPTFYS